MTTASGIRARFILTPGYRPAVGEEGAQESISNAAKLAKALMDELSDVGCSALKVDEGKAALLKLNKSWFGVKAQQDLLYF